MNKDILRLVETYNAHIGHSFPIRGTLYADCLAYTFGRMNRELLEAAIAIVRLGMPDTYDIPARMKAMRALRGFRHFGCVDVFPMV